MRIALKLLAALIALLVSAVVAGIVWVETSYLRDFSSVPLPDIHASANPKLIARGDYIANALAHCAACHGPEYYVRRHALSANRADLRGGFTLRAGPFGIFRAANLTSDVQTGIGDMNDGQLARAIRSGIDRNGSYAAFMAFSVGQLSDEDLTALVSYLRSLPPKSNAVAQDEWGFVAKLLAHGFEPHAEPPLQHVVEGGISAARGRYLANGPAGCYNCHSRRDPMHGFAFIGARFTGNPDADPDELDPSYEIAAPNLTPDPETGRSGQMTEDQFVARMRAGRVLASSHMPWESFARMTEDDVRSIYRYLRSLPPQKNDVGPLRRPRGWKKR